MHARTSLLIQHSHNRFYFIS